MEALFIIICRYPLRLSSKITVNGPSFSKDTFISAPKIPCSTTGTCLLASEIIYSYNLFASSGAPDEANKLYEYIISEASKQVPVVEHGIFGADMKVSLENDGPFTVIFDESLRG